MVGLEESEHVSLASTVFAERISLVVTMTAIAYDYILSVGEEAELIWASPLSMVKVLFLLNRYNPFIGIAGFCFVYISFNARDHLERCVPVFWAFASSIFLQFYLSGLILIVRAYAVWGGGRGTKQLLMLGIGCLLVWIPGIYCGGRFLRSATVMKLRIFPTGCLIKLEGRIDFLGMIDLLIFETMAVTALVIKAVQMPQSNIMKRMSSDGILFYVIILGATIANLIVLRTTSPAICNLLLAPQAALHSICCNRLLLRLRREAARTEFVHDSQSHQLPSSPPGSFLPSSQTSSEGIEMRSF